MYRKFFPDILMYKYFLMLNDAKKFSILKLKICINFRLLSVNFGINPHSFYSHYIYTVVNRNTTEAVLRYRVHAPPIQLERSVLRMMRKRWSVSHAPSLNACPLSRGGHLIHPSQHLERHHQNIS